MKTAQKIIRLEQGAKQISHARGRGKAALELLAQIQKERGWSKRRVLKRLHISPESVRRWEQGVEPHAYQILGLQKMLLQQKTGQCPILPDGTMLVIQINLAELNERTRQQIKAAQRTLARIERLYP